MEKNRISVSFRLEKQYADLLKKIAEKDERSQTAIIQILIREKAEKMKITL